MTSKRLTQESNAIDGATNRKRLEALGIHHFSSYMNLLHEPERLERLEYIEAKEAEFQ